MPGAEGVNPGAFQPVPNVFAPAVQKEVTELNQSLQAAHHLSEAVDNNRYAVLFMHKDGTISSASYRFGWVGDLVAACYRGFAGATTYTQTEALEKLSEREVQQLHQVVNTTKITAQTDAQNNAVSLVTPVINGLIERVQGIYQQKAAELQKARKEADPKSAEETAEEKKVKADLQKFDAGVKAKLHQCTALVEQRRAVLQTLNAQRLVSRGDRNWEPFVKLLETHNDQIDPALMAQYKKQAFEGILESTAELRKQLKDRLQNPNANMLMKDYLELRKYSALSQRLLMLDSNNVGLSPEQSRQIAVLQAGPEAMRSKILVGLSTMLTATDQTLTKESKAQAGVAKRLTAAEEAYKKTAEVYRQAVGGLQGLIPDEGYRMLLSHLTPTPSKEVSLKEMLDGMIKEGVPGQHQELAKLIASIEGRPNVLVARVTGMEEPLSSAQVVSAREGALKQSSALQQAFQTLYAIKLKQFKALLPKQRQKVDELLKAGPEEPSVGGFVRGLVGLEDPAAIIREKMRTEKEERGRLQGLTDSIQNMERILKELDPSNAVSARRLEELLADLVSGLDERSTQYMYNNLLKTLPAEVVRPTTTPGKQTLLVQYLQGLDRKIQDAPAATAARVQWDALVKQATEDLGKTAAALTAEIVGDQRTPAMQLKIRIRNQKLLQEQEIPKRERALKAYVPLLEAIPSFLQAQESMTKVAAEQKSLKEAEAAVQGRKAGVAALQERLKQADNRTDLELLYRDVARVTGQEPMAQAAAMAAEVKGIAAARRPSEER